DVEQDELDSALRDALDRLLSVLDRLDGVTGATQDAREHVARDAVVVGDQDTARSYVVAAALRGRSLTAGCRRGRRAREVARSHDAIVSEDAPERNGFDVRRRQ